jgi:hypothetical protein
MGEPLKWYDANATDNPPWIKALADVRHLTCREGWLSPCPGNPSFDRPIRGKCAWKSVVFPEPAAQHWARPKR